MKTMLSHLIEQFHCIYNGSPWYGDSLLQKLEKVDAEAVFTTPAPGLHSVAQQVAHILSWRRVLAERLKGNAGYQVKINSASDWPSHADLQAKGWDAILAELAENQQEIIQLLSAETDDLLDRLFDGKRTFRMLMEGILQHDIYHIGQIGLVLTLINEEKLSQKV